MKNHLQRLPDGWEDYAVIEPLPRLEGPYKYRRQSNVWESDLTVGLADLFAVIGFEHVGIKHRRSVTFNGVRYVLNCSFAGYHVQPGRPPRIHLMPHDLDIRVWESQPFVVSRLSGHIDVDWHDTDPTQSQDAEFIRDEVRAWFHHRFLGLPPRELVLLGILGRSTPPAAT